MASRRDIVVDLFNYDEKIPFSQATAEQKAQVLRDVNSAIRYTYNNGDKSFKTVIKRGFVYTVQTDLTKPSRGTVLPANFLGFHQTGGIFVEGYTPKKKVNHYIAPHEMMDYMEGDGQKITQSPPTHWTIMGPSEGDETVAGYVGANQRELVLWPTPVTPTINLTLVYQRVPPTDGVVIEVGSPPYAVNDWRLEIVPIPATWHTGLIYPMASMLRKMDKSANTDDKQQIMATALKQFLAQDPHGREKPTHRQPNPAWRRIRGG
jgi:hypothetical protein